jgi:hypothetical protein
MDWFNRLAKARWIYPVPRVLSSFSSIISFEKTFSTTFSARRSALRADLGGFLVASKSLGRDWNASGGILNSAAEL